jgi:threonine dehydratase
MFLDVPIKQTEIDTMMEARGADHVRDILEALNEAGFPSRLLTD